MDFTVILLLLLMTCLSWRTNSNALRCAYNDQYDRLVKEDGLDEFISEVFNSGDASKNHQATDRCYINIMVMHMNRTTRVSYYTNSTQDGTPDRLRLNTYLVLDEMIVINTLSYVCASGDYCEQIFVKSWLPRLYKAHWQELTEKIIQIVNLNGTYADSPRCLITFAPKNCSSKVCSIKMEHDSVVRGCFNESDRGVSETLPVSISMNKLVVLKNSFDPFSNSLLNHSVYIPDAVIEDRQRYAHIQYLCKIEMCNQNEILRNISYAVQSAYKLQKIIGFQVDSEVTLSPPNSTSTSNSIDMFTHNTAPTLLIHLIVIRVVSNSCTNRAA